ncbi:MAG: alpha/beta hydrolase-fold protein [Bradymonadales bacterium]|jgi:predicted alpha/beta superfamily hydrolase
MGKIKVIKDFYSPLDKINRTIRIYTPDSYDDKKKKRYPVAYMTDGQNIFSDPRSALFHTWCVNTTLESLWESGELEREWIVVGIDHLPDRFAEYTPWVFPAARIIDAQGRKFLNNLTEFIVPFINQEYRTLSGPENTALIGASLGGLMALFCARERPDVIGRIGAVSPSLMWSDFKSFEHWDSRYDMWTKIYLDMGSDERITVQGIYLDYASVTYDFYKHLRTLGYADHEVHLFIENGGKHHEIDWARRFPHIAKTLLNDNFE